MAKGASFRQKHILHNLSTWVRDRVSKAASEEMDELHKKVFIPINLEELTLQEKRKSMEALMFLNKKRDNSIKGWMVYNGKPTQ